jgi:hypothetical protein
MPAVAVSVVAATATDSTRVLMTLFMTSFLRIRPLPVNDANKLEDCG